MRFVADEGVDRAIVDRLRGDGHEVRSIAEAAPGSMDEEVLQLAAAEHALLVTADKDFGELIFRLRRSTAWVVLLRLAGMAPNDKAALVGTVIAQLGEEMRGALSVITAQQTRIRPPLPNEPEQPTNPDGRR